MAALSELKGKTLGCWCKPNPCHGDVLLTLLKEEQDQRAQQTLTTTEPICTFGQNKRQQKTSRKNDRGKRRRIEQEDRGDIQACFDAADVQSDCK